MKGLRFRLTTVSYGVGGRMKLMSMQELTLPDSSDKTKNSIPELGMFRLSTIGVLKSTYF